MAALADPQSGKYSYSDPLSFICSKKIKKLNFHDQNIAFYLKFLISTPGFPEKVLFHLEASSIYFLKNIEPFAVGST